MTVGREQPTRRAISVLDVPWAASSRILARSTRAARIEPERLHWPRVCRSSAAMASGGAIAGMSNRAATTPHPSSKFRDGLLGLVVRDVDEQVHGTLSLQRSRTYVVIVRVHRVTQCAPFWTVAHR